MIFFWWFEIPKKLQVNSNFGKIIWDTSESTQNIQCRSVYQISLQKFDTNKYTQFWSEIRVEKLIQLQVGTNDFKQLQNFLSLTNVYMQSNSHFSNFTKIISPRMASSQNLKEGPNFCFSSFDWMIEIGILMFYIFFYLLIISNIMKVSKVRNSKILFSDFLKICFSKFGSKSLNGNIGVLHCQALHIRFDRLRSINIDFEHISNN